MYKVRLDITGEVYGYLKALEYRGKTKANQAVWLFECLACGKTIEKPAFHARSGNTSSCGCISNKLKSIGKTKHGVANLPEYTSYRSMLARCMNPSNPLYHRYGGRGISVCQRWLGPDGPANFLADMGRKPSAEHSIERINNDGNYEPKNCVWATKAEQMQTRSTTKLIEFGGLTMSIAAWERHLGFGNGVVRDRLKRGWSIEDALTRKPAGRRHSDCRPASARNPKSP